MPKKVRLGDYLLFQRPSQREPPYEDVRVTAVDPENLKGGLYLARQGSTLPEPSTIQSSFYHAATLS